MEDRWEKEDQQSIEDHKVTLNFKVEPQDGVKHDDGKVRYDLIAPEALHEYAKVLTFGANKYNDRNWEKGIAYGRLLGACLRHIFSWVRGETIDVESGLHPLAHAICCLNFLLTYELRGMTEFDDIHK